MFFKHFKMIESNPNSIYSSHSELLFFITILYSITHTSNGILDQNLLSFRTIREVSVFPPPTKPRIAAIRLVPQILLTPVMKEIFAGVILGNTWKNWTLRRIIRTGIDGSIPISTPIHSRMSKYNTPYSSESSGTRIPI